MTVFLFGLVYYGGDASSAGGLLIINEGLYPSENSFECLGTFIAAPIGSILWTFGAFGLRTLYTYILSKFGNRQFDIFEKKFNLDPSAIAGNQQNTRQSTLSDREPENGNSNNLRHRGRRDNLSDGSGDSIYKL